MPNRDPARLASTRLPELLQRVAGKSALRHTYEAACRSELASSAILARTIRRGCTIWGSMPSGALCHLGLYAYRREFLQWFARQPPSPLELAEKLEQLRAVEAGRRVVVAHVASATPGIDTEEDLLAFRRRVEPGGR